MTSENTENKTEIASKYDMIITVLSFFCLVISIGSLVWFNDLFIPFFIIGYTDACFFLSIPFLIIACIDAYFIFVIFYAALKSDSHKRDNWWCNNAIPNRFAGVFIFAFLYLAVILAFAAIFKDLNLKEYNTCLNAFYKSAISITSFSYDNYNNHCWYIQLIQLFQSFNGILLLTATFGFLISRISSFRDEHTMEDLYKLVSEKIADPSKITKMETDIQGINQDAGKIKSDIEGIRKALENPTNDAPAGPESKDKPKKT